MPNGLPPPGTDVFLTQLPSLVADRFKGQFSQTTNFLECGFQSEKLVLGIESFVSLQRMRPTPARPFTIHKVRMKVARPDNPHTDGPTSHVAVLLNMPDCWILIDTTHLQYDLPYADTDKDASALRIKYSSLMSGFQPFTFHHQFVEPVLIAWRNFISGKPKVKFIVGAEILDRDAIGTKM